MKIRSITSLVLRISKKIIPLYMMILLMLTSFVTFASPVYAAGITPLEQVWYSGGETGKYLLDFTSEPPKVTCKGPVGQSDGNEGTASFTDPNTGKLRLYTDGRKAFNGQTNKLLTNGAGLKGNPSATEAALIVPMPGESEDKFYIFSNTGTEYADRKTDGVFYSIVDLSQGGNGKITTKNKRVAPASTEALSIVPHTNRTDFWVLLINPRNNSLDAYKVDKNGVSSKPVSSQLGVSVNAYLGSITFSPDYNTLAIGVSDTIKTASIDRTQGKVSILKTVANSGAGYTTSFSPDGTKLYFTYGRGYGALGTYLYQYDLKTNSKTELAGNISPSRAGSKLAPNGKIYWSGSGVSSLSVVNYPDKPGKAADLQLKKLYLQGCVGSYNLPNQTAASIRKTNRRPVIKTPLSVVSTGTKDGFSYTIPKTLFSDPDGEDLALDVSLANEKPLPSWLKFDKKTNTLSGQPTRDDVGLLEVQVTAKDTNGGETSTPLKLEIINTNTPPSVTTPVPDQLISTGQKLDFTIPANAISDPDGDPLKISASLDNGKDLPTWLKFDGSTFSGTPPTGSQGQLNLKITATDDSDTSVSDTFTLTINGVPTLANPIQDTKASTGQAFDFTVPSDTFSDPEGNDLSFSAGLANGQSLPKWLTYDAKSNSFSGTPPAGSEGVVNVTVTATDPDGSAITDTFTLAINGTPTVATTIANQSDAQGAIARIPYSFTLPTGVFTDPEGDQLALSASLSDGKPLPSWLTFDSTTGLFSGTPADENEGTAEITVTATDALGASVSTTFSVEVRNALAAKETVTCEDGGPLYYLTEPMSWTDAQAEAQSFNGNLITVNDQDELDCMMGEFGDAQPFWIGLNDAKREGKFQWASGQPFDFDQWNDDEPTSSGRSGEDEDYVIMNFTYFGDWGDVENDGSYYGEPVPGIVEIEP